MGCYLGETHISLSGRLRAWNMDIEFEGRDGTFSYRACAVIINNNRILAMQDEKSPYFYLPGGRVKFHETAEHAVQRELKEELCIEASIIRPLWLNQAFFTHDVNHEIRHELCLYFLVDVAGTDLLNRGQIFHHSEGKHHFVFEWLAFSRMQNEYLYPRFIKDKLHDLPVTLTLINETE